jgi:ABC-type iron transport system FetAB permease component
MTSQVLAGTDPLEAAEYQILPIFLLWAAVASPPSLWFTLRQCD